MNNRCEKKGHKYKTKEVRIRKNSNISRIVCTDHLAEITTCSRCGETLEPKILEEIDWYNSVTMPSHYWDEIREKGYTIIR